MPPRSRQAYYLTATEVAAYVPAITAAIENATEMSKIVCEWNRLVNKLIHAFATLLDDYASSGNLNSFTVYWQDLVHYRRLIGHVNEIDDGTRLYIKIVR